MQLLSQGHSADIINVRHWRQMSTLIAFDALLQMDITWKPSFTNVK